MEEGEGGRSARYSRCESSFKKRTVNAKETKNSEKCCQLRAMRTLKFYRFISVHLLLLCSRCLLQPGAARSLYLIMKYCL